MVWMEEIRYGDCSSCVRERQSERPWRTTSNVMRQPPAASTEDSIDVDCITHTEDMKRLPKISEWGRDEKSQQ